MRSRTAALFVLFVILLFPIMNHVYAADDSNYGSLSLSQTNSSQIVVNAMSSLAQGTNDSSTSQLISQLKSQIRSGNYAGANQTLLQLQQLARQDSNVPPSLKDLIQSTSGSSNGLSVNTTRLASLLASGSNSSGLIGESPTKSFTDLNTLAGLLQTIDPTLANQLLNQADQISATPNGGASQQQHIGASVNPPSIQTPVINVRAPTSFPALGAVELVMPWLIILAAAFLYFGRKRVVPFLGRQTLRIEETHFNDFEKEDFDPSNPKHRIFAAFAKTVRTMRARGVSKLKSETHREFSAKCQKRPESEHVNAVSSLYEMAKFSGRDVGHSEVQKAESEASEIEAAS
ncbi:MAG: DUF4129 domain-containing protein [Nitrososphaerota archaeon]|nr:DUF4129 domain-containing protein [Nitrososphaerota archaeon]